MSVIPVKQKQMFCCVSRLRKDNWTGRWSVVFLGSGKTIGLAVGLPILFLALLAIAGVIVYLHIRSM